jgi:preprotein translocase subunit SecA
MFNIFKKYLDPNAKAIESVMPTVEAIIELEPKVIKMSLVDMQKRVDEMKKELIPLLDEITDDQKDNIKTKKEFGPDEKEIQNKLYSFIPEFFAFLREINNRKFNKKHFKVQLIASVILAKGNALTELRTGEGKTQVFHLPAALYGLTGRGSHVVTVNDYLARRDGEYAGHAMADLGVSVGIVTPQACYKFVRDDDLLATKGEEAVEARKDVNIASLTQMNGVNLVECTKQEAYSQDVLYGTNNELGFDYLRDNMVYDLTNRVQKELYFCIVDEADSILIDEARTPLIISAPAEKSNELYEKFAGIVRQLTPEKHFVVDEKAHSATLTEDGIAYAEQILGVSNIWEDYELAHHLDNSLKALTLFKNNDEYIVKNGEILIVDEFTGRILPGRRYSEGLHQAIEAKEGVEIRSESNTLATITFQNYFRLYKILAGGSGTILTEAEEFSKIYHLDSYVVPPNRQIIRKDLPDKIYKNKEAKFKAVAEEILEISKTGQPILVGTATIDDSELVSGLIDKRGVKHQVLNAKFHEQEAQIVAKAGFKGSVTVATNMAGRGTDIPLEEGVVALGGLYIVGTQRHEARRIDNQLRGRAGRQGDPGSSQFFIALDDEIMRIQGGDMVKKFMDMTNIPEDIPIQSGLITKTIESAQKKMEGHNFDIRKRVVDYDDVINQQREIFYTKRLNIIKITASASKIDELKSTILDMLEENLIAFLNEYQYLEQVTDEDKKSMLIGLLDLTDDDLIIKFFKEKNPDLEFKSYIRTEKSIENIKEKVIELYRAIMEYKFNDFSENISEIYKITSLQIMDELWTEHLEAMTDLREGIGLLGYAQRDPLVEYKNNAFTVFEKFINKVNGEIIKRLLRIKRVVQQRNIFQGSQTNAAKISDMLTGSREMAMNEQKGETNQPEVLRPVINTVKVGRNDPCPCGSGLKYKKCGMINSSKHKS